MMIGSRGEMTVNVKREELIKILKENLEKHKKELAETIELYYIQVEKDLKQLLKDIRNKDRKQISFHPQRPKSYERTYKETIEMLELSVDEHIRLDMDNFRKFVKDEWEWKDSFMTISNSYKVGVVADDD